MKKIITFIVAFSVFMCCLNLTVFADEENKFYVVLGDSIAYGSGLTNSVEACYGRIVADTNGYEYINHAVSGETSEDLINKMKEEAVNSDLHKADIISISIGGNDFLKNSPSDLIFDAVLEDDYSRFVEISESFYDNLCIIIDEINAINEDAVILMQNLYNPQSGDFGELCQYGVDGINAMIERYSEENPGEIEIIDVCSAFGNDSDNIAKDGIHPSAKGNVVIAELILDKLFELGLGASSEPVIVEEGRNIRASLFRDMSIKLLAFAVKVLAFFYRSAVGLRRNL